MLHDTYCPNCLTPHATQAEVSPKSNRIYQCPNCQGTFNGPAWPGKCPHCANMHGLSFIRKLKPEDKLQTGTCEPCAAKFASLREAVHAGGIFFRCTSCQKDGVLSAETKFAKDTRAKAGKPAPEEVYVTINSCPECEEKG